MADQMAFLLFGDQSLIIHDCLADFFAGANQTCPTKGAGEGSLHALPSLVVSLQLRDSSSISHL
jgi:hypothetical protein